MCSFIKTGGKIAEKSAIINFPFIISNRRTEKRAKFMKTGISRIQIYMLIKKIALAKSIGIHETDKMRVVGIGLNTTRNSSFL